MKKRLYTLFMFSVLLSLALSFTSFGENKEKNCGHIVQSLVTVGTTGSSRGKLEEFASEESKKEKNESGESLLVTVNVEKEKTEEKITDVNTENKTEVTEKHTENIYGAIGVQHPMQ